MGLSTPRLTTIMEPTGSRRRMLFWIGLAESAFGINILARMPVP